MVRTKEKINEMKPGGFGKVQPIVESVPAKNVVKESIAEVRTKMTCSLCILGMKIESSSAFQSVNGMFFAAYETLAKLNAEEVCGKCAYE